MNQAEVMRDFAKDAGTASHSKETHSAPYVVIEPDASKRLINLGEVLAYRDLLRYMIWKQIRVRYAQSSLGIGWAVIQPLFSMVIFTLIFGNLAKLDSDGTPYALFSLAALLPWTYFSNAITEGVASLVSEADLMKKVYFPRLILPLTSVGSKLVDFAIASVIMVIVMVWFQQPPSAEIIWLPLAILIMVTTALGVSVWLTALAIQYRDVRYAMNFMVQILMYASPVVYSLQIVPESYRTIYALNPMVGVIECFRVSILGTSAMPWDIVATGFVSSLIVLFTGLIFFNSKESIFTDVA